MGNKAIFNTMTLSIDVRIGIEKDKVVLLLLYAQYEDEGPWKLENNMKDEFWDVGLS